MKMKIILIIWVLLISNLFAAQLVDFNNTADLTYYYTSSGSESMVNYPNEGLSNSGCVRISGLQNDIEVWTYNMTSIQVPNTGETIYVSMYFYNAENNGRNGLGFSSNSTNFAIYPNIVVSQNPAIGIDFNGNGGSFHNDTSTTNITSFQDIELDSWYKVVMKLSYQGSDEFDLNFELWKSDLLGNLNSTPHVTRSYSGMVNSNFASALEIFPYFGNSDTRSSHGDNFEFGIYDDSPLPVTLSSFSGTFTNGSSMLAWTTQSESNNLGWNVYRSETENIVESVQANSNLVEGAGTTTEQTDYTFADTYETYTNSSYWYWIESVDNSGSTSLHGPARVDTPEDNDELPPELITNYGLAQNYPNPFNPSTKIAYKAAEGGVSDARLIIYNPKGQIVKIFTDLSTNEDELGSVTWDGNDMSGNAVSSGIYFYKLKMKDTELTKKMIMIK
jgi:hypothetical protein